MAAEKRFIKAFDNPDTGDRITLYAERYRDHELVPKFKIITLDGDFRTPSRLFGAIEEWADLQNGESIFNCFNLYLPGLTWLRETLEALETE